MVVSPIAELYVPLLIAALWEVIPVPDRLHEAGTATFTSSITLSSAETMEEKKKPENRLRTKRSFPK